LAAHLKELCIEFGDVEIMISHEVGKETHREHTHAYMRCSAYFRMQGAVAPDGSRNYFWPFWFQHGGVWYKPDVRRPKKNQRKNRDRDAIRIIQYLEKEDEAPYTTFDRAAYFEQTTIVDAFESGDTARLEREVNGLQGLEALLRIKDMMSTRVQYTERPLFRHLKVWDAKAISIVARPANDPRTANWFYGPAGNQGKSMLCCWMNKVNPLDILYLDFAVGKDFCALVLAAVGYGFTGRMIIIDMTRSESEYMAQHGSCIYSIIENMKKGVFQNTKYQCKRVSLQVEHPHILVMSNVAPDLRQLSADRWNVVPIETPENQAEMPSDWLQQFVGCRYFQSDCPSVQAMKASLLLEPRWSIDPRVPTDDVPPIGGSASAASSAPGRR